MESYEIGDHLYCWLTENNIPYTHHGLYVGYGKVIEKCRDGVKLSSLHSFSEGNEIYVRQHFFRTFTRDSCCHRAYTQLNNNSYNIVFDNCEAFVNWCINGMEIDTTKSRKNFTAILTTLLKKK